MNTFTEILKMLWECIITFFKSDLPERLMVWLGSATEGLVNICREIIDMFVN